MNLETSLPFPIVHGDAIRFPIRRGDSVRRRHWAFVFEWAKAIVYLQLAISVRITLTDVRCQFYIGHLHARLSSRVNRSLERNKWRSATANVPNKQHVLTEFICEWTMKPLKFQRIETVVCSLFDVGDSTRVDNEHFACHIVLESTLQSHAIFLHQNCLYLCLHQKCLSGR